MKELFKTLIKAVYPALISLFFIFYADAHGRTPFSGYDFAQFLVQVFSAIAIVGFVGYIVCVIINGIKNKGKDENKKD